MVSDNGVHTARGRRIYLLLMPRLTHIYHDCVYDTTPEVQFSIYRNVCQTHGRLFSPDNKRYNLHVTLNLARADIASATGGQGDGSLLLVIPQAGYLPADDNEVEDGDEGENGQP